MKHTPNTAVKDGDIFGRWTVISVPEIVRYDTGLPCKCNCGTVRSVKYGLLKGGHSKSCGCFQKDFQRERQTKHGGAGTTEYVIWKSMKARCYNPKYRDYKWYGGRGIKVCKRWLDSFANFLADMGKRPSKNHTLERIRNNGNYNPSNCKWATYKEQAANRRWPVKRKPIQ